MAATAGVNHHHHHHHHHLQQQQQQQQQQNLQSRMNFMEDNSKSGNFLQQQQQQWMPDERDAFISWLRSEFAAANAIIDSLCQHLTSVVGGPGEYDHVLNCLRQRRFNWSSILHMQQYFSVEEVVLALQRASQLKRRQMQAPPRAIGSGELPVWPDRRSASANSNSESRQTSSSCTTTAATTTIELDHHIESSSTKVSAEDLQQQQRSSSHEEHDSLVAGANQDFQDDKPAAEQDDDNTSVVIKLKPPQCFQSQEIIDGRVLNIVEGLKVWEVFNALQCEYMSSLMDDLDGAGRKIEIGGRGHKIIGGKRFLKAKGGEQAQQNAPDDDRSSPEELTESLPPSLELIANRLVDCQILPASKRPDSFIVSFLGEEGYLLPQIHNQEFEHPYCIVFLHADCTIAIGRCLNMDSPGEFRCQFKLTVAPGTVLSLQGNAAKLARYAIPALPTKRCCIVLGKMLTKRGGGASRNSGFPGQRLNAGLITRPASSPNFNNICSLHIGGPPPSVHQASPNASGAMQHGFVPPPPQGGPYPPMPLVVPPGWSPVPRPPRLMSGTGVFLPYNASSGPGRPSANRCRQPFLQKTNSLPASFRTQNGVSSCSSSSSCQSKATAPGEPSSASGNPNAQEAPACLEAEPSSPAAAAA